jgi:hypothetical protein
LGVASLTLVPGHLSASTALAWPNMKDPKIMQSAMQTHVLRVMTGSFLRSLATD